jgi:hypothetical protein
MLGDPDLLRGTQLLVAHLEEIIESEPEIEDIHEAFELYCARRCAIGDPRNQVRTDGSNQLGIDFYFRHGHIFHVGQCKIPATDYMKKDPTKAKIFGVQAVGDIEDAIRYLLEDSNEKANERVQQLRAYVLNSKDAEDFQLKLYLVVFGRLKPNALEQFKKIKAQYDSERVTLILQELDDLAEEFLLGANKSDVEISFPLRTNVEEMLRSPDYCYFLANARDLYSAFVEYGWRIFDLNVRMEIRNSDINEEIVNSLKHPKSRKRFHHYNNGLIIIAKNYRIREREGKVQVTGGQIINGLQTVKSIYNAVKSGEVKIEEIDKECVVQVKLIKTTDNDLASRIVRSTNNQNPMAPRNLRSNSSEQKSLRRDFTSIEPKWFYQIKEGEWDSLTSENAHFFEQIVGSKISSFKPQPSKKAGRVIDNQDAAKAWLAFMGFADISGDRVTHYFSDDGVYELAFKSRPSQSYWKEFGAAIDWDKGREAGLESVQGDALQYMLAYFLWRYSNSFIPSPAKYREIALDEGVAARKVQKADGSFKGTEADHNQFLAGSETYQTWRLMSNMKELMVESAAQILARRYGPLTTENCKRILDLSEPKSFMSAADIRQCASDSAMAKEIGDEMVFGRIFRMLHFVCGQFWDQYKETLLSTSRLRTVLVKRESAASYKRLLWEFDGRAQRDWAWKEAGRTFLDSLPKL